MIKGLTPQKIVEELNKYIISQDEAKKYVAISLRNRDRRKSIDNEELRKEITPKNIILMGPTGVGKTELSKALAEAMFEDEDSIVRIDMSEYMEKHSVSKLIGSPPGYVGYDEGGQLTEKIRRKP